MIIEDKKKLDLSIIINKPIASLQRTILPILNSLIELLIKINLQTQTSLYLPQYYKKRSN
jgi:hypothetical protein